MVLVVRLAVTKNRGARELNAELGTTHAVVHDLRVTVDKSRVDAGLLALVLRRLFVQVGNLEVGVRTEKELSVLTLLGVELGVTLHRHADLVLAPSHALKFTLELVRVATEHLDDLRILDTVEKLDGTTVVHETRDGTVKCLRAEGSPDTSAKGVLRSGRLETNAVERKIVNLALSGILLALLVVTVELRCLIGENLGVLDEAVPLMRMQLFEVLKESDTGVWLILANNFTERQKDLFTVVRNQDSECRHVVHGERLRDGS